MGKRRKQLLMKNLTRLKEKLLAELREELIRSESPDMSTRLDEIIEEGDLAQYSVEKEINGRIWEMKSKDLRRIDKALDLLEKGDYGICQNCDEEIEEKRLQVLPFADLCLNCQQENEDRVSSRALAQVYD